MSLVVYVMLLCCISLPVVGVIFCMYSFVQFRREFLSQIHWSQLCLVSVLYVSMRQLTFCALDPHFQTTELNSFVLLVRYPTLLLVLLSLWSDNNNRITPLSMLSHVLYSTQQLKQGITQSALMCQVKSFAKVVAFRKAG